MMKSREQGVDGVEKKSLKSRETRGEEVVERAGEERRADVHL